MTQKRNKMFPSNSHPNAGVSFIFLTWGKAQKVGIKMKTPFIYIALAGVTFRAVITSYKNLKNSSCQNLLQILLGVVFTAK